MSTITAKSSEKNLFGLYRRSRLRTAGRSRKVEQVETPTPETGMVGCETLIARVGERFGEEVAAFFRMHLPTDSTDVCLLENVEREAVDSLPQERRALAVLERANNSRRINKYFRAVNSRLELGGIFLGCAEVNGQRRDRFFRNHSAPVAHVAYFFDFLVHRICPKIPYIKPAYFALTGGRNRPVARSEALGRLISCGFEVVEYREIGGLMYFAVRKVRDSEDVPNPTYGPFCSLRRVGIGGEVFTVYKFRTMHPYSEFLQEYLYDKHNLQDGGKFLNDFRITPWGRWMRRLWLDELPMLLNLFKGELKLVGVRPLSRQYYGLYPDELKQLRNRHMPGLVPPFYVDLPKSFDDIVASEVKYLRAYEKAPFRTDIKYLVIALWNIFVKRARSA
jgi:lipopolysaccharide/colanic/teichoic acid biosynthesis glycosyltransferase